VVTTFPPPVSGVPDAAVAIGSLHAAAGSPDRLVVRLFLDLAIVVVVAVLAGALARRIGQPSVVGEILAGLALGPSLLGLLPGDLTGVLFPADVRSLLSAMAQLGLALFMFLVGYELDPARLAGAGRTAAAVSAAAIAVPFAGGFAVVAVLWRDDGGDGGWMPLGLFIGAAMAITAFPVLARILQENGLRQSRTGALTLLCAAINDFLAWCLLALVATIVAATGVVRLGLVIGGSVLFVLGMLLVVRPVLRALARRLPASPRSESIAFVAMVAGLLLSSWATAALGLHVVFGAFLFGMVMPRAEVTRAVPHVPERVGQLNALLLPVFFVVTGLSVDIRGLGWTGVAELFLVVTVASGSKFLAAALAAWLTGFGRRAAVAVGVLMNARGLTELIVLNVGLQLGVLDTRLFTIMVIMAVVTTVMTAPLLRLATRSGTARRPAPAAGRRSEHDTIEDAAASGLA
jgi:Kef-type K+ transport system membrane component KefB